MKSLQVTTFFFVAGLAFTSAPTYAAPCWTCDSNNVCAGATGGANNCATHPSGVGCLMSDFSCGAPPARVKDPKTGVTLTHVRKCGASKYSDAKNTEGGKPNSKA